MEYLSIFISTLEVCDEYVLISLFEFLNKIF